MKTVEKRLTALLLAACLLLGLAACGNKGGTDNDSQTISGTVYVPTFSDIISDAEYINQGCAGENYFYFLGQVKGEEHEETSTWFDETTGEEQSETYTYYDYRTGLFRVPLEGGTAEELPGYTPAQLPEGAEGSVDIRSLRSDKDGTLWIMEYVSINNFDLPEGFDEATGNKWDYYTDSTETVTLRHLDSEGVQLDSLDLSALAEKAELDYSYSTVMDGAGNIYTNSDTKLAVLDKDLNLLFALEGENMWGELIPLADGSVGMRNSYYDEEREVSGIRLQVVDVANQGWGASYELSQSSYEIYPGGGDYLFYYRSGESIYGHKADAAEGEKVFSWISADIDMSNVQFFSFLSDGRVAALMQDWNDQTRKYESAILTPTDASTLPQKTTLSYACMGLGYDVRNQIIEFNKASTQYRIEVMDYSEFNTGEDTSAGLTKMNTEILAGRVPDILDASGSMPISQYGSKGLLEDLWPFIESDEEIGGRDGVMEKALQAAEQDGKLYRVFDLFDIRTVVGASRIVGERISWTLADLQNALAQMPEGCTIFGESDTKDAMLRTILACNMDSFVDWSTGSCSFDSPSFKSLLEFCNSFPAEFNWDNVDWDQWEEPDQRVSSGKQLLQSIYLDRFTSVQRYEAVFGGDVSFVGYPMEDGGIGSSFQIMGSRCFAMSSTSQNKEGAWSFIRQALLPQLEDGEEYWLGDYPVNRKDFERYRDDSMTVTYLEDENGQPILDENGEPIQQAKESYWTSDSDTPVEFYAATQEDVDQVMELYNSITSIWSSSDSIFDIIQENVGAYFAGDRTVDDTATRIQSAVKLYIGEQM